MHDNLNFSYEPYNTYSFRDEGFSAKPAMNLFQGMQMPKIPQMPRPDMMPHMQMRPVNMELTMAYVPDQQWDKTYENEMGLSRGTIFPELDKPFMGKGGFFRDR